mgnify:CR=1 FL=1
MCSCSPTNAWKIKLMGEADRQRRHCCCCCCCCVNVVQAARLEAIRMKQLYPYSCDGSTYPRQPWATYTSLMAPQVIRGCTTSRALPAG